VLGGVAWTGWSSRKRWTSCAIASRAVVPTGAVLLQRLHHDPVEVAAQDPSQEVRRACGGSFATTPISSPIVESFVLGFGGSTSRMYRRISS
jgi:hypothetical protein